MWEILPVRRVQLDAQASYDPGAWPFMLPAVAQLLSNGLDLKPGVTFLVGENGSGKSTLVEALAAACGLNVEGGSKGALHRTRESESPLGGVLQLIRNPGPMVSSYFLRAETMHGLYTYLEDNPSPSDRARHDAGFHEMSHGESFLEIIRSRFRGYGFFLMDEPEAALSFTSCLGLVAALEDLRREGAQAVIATHSPILAALPGATLLEVGARGLCEVAYDDLDLVRDWRGFLEAPDRFLRHLVD